MLKKLIVYRNEFIGSGNEIIGKTFVFVKHGKKKKKAYTHFRLSYSYIIFLSDHM